METKLKVLRIDDVVSPGEILVVPLGWELDEVKNAAFRLVYPGNGDAPYQTKLQTLEGIEIEDVSLISVLPDGAAVVNPGEDFEDNALKVKEKKGAFSRFRSSIRRGSDRDSDKESDKEEKRSSEKEKNLHKRRSFFDSIRKNKAPDFSEKDSHLPDWLRLQKRIFTRYVNQKFRMENSKTRVEDLAQDCKDGVVIVELLEIMSGKVFPDKKLKQVKVRIKQIDNCAAALNFAKGICGITTDCSTENIVDGDEKALMSFIFQIILKYMKLDDNDEDADTMDIRQALTIWLKSKLQPYGIEVDEKSFCKTFVDGMAFCALLHRLRPRLIPFKDLIKEQKIKNLTLALEVAEQYAGVQQYVEPSDISKLDELGMIVYLSDWYHGISFMELQNGGARRIAKLIEMTRHHDQMKAEYEQRAKTLVSWIDQKIKQLDDHTFDNTLEGIKSKKAEFYSYKIGEKGEKVSEHMEIDALFDDLALRLTSNNRPPFNPPHGLTPQELRAKLKDLETSENNRALAMQKELERQLRLYRTAERFNEENNKVISWIETKDAYLAIKESSSSVAQVLNHLNVLTSFDKEWNSVQGSRIAFLSSLSDELSNGNYIFKSDISKKLEDTKSKFQSLSGKSQSKNEILNKDLELEKKKEQLRLDFAAACSDYVLYSNDQIASCGIYYFGDTLPNVESYESTLTSIENDMNAKFEEKKKKALEVHSSLVGLSVSDFKYTTVTPDEISSLENKYKEAIKTRRDAYNTELGKQRSDDNLCRTYGQKMEDFTSWLKSKKSSVNDESLEVEPRLELVIKELENSKSEADQHFEQLSSLDQQMAEAGITHNDYAKASTREAKALYDQYVEFLNKVKKILDAEIYRRKTKGLTQEDRDEIKRNFIYFDTDSSGFLERREFRACLQSLGYDASPTAVSNFIELYDVDKDGKISLEEFTDLMLKRLEDTDSSDEIVEAFTTINQNTYAKVEYLNAVVHEIIFPQEHVEYLIKEMEPQEDGYNFTTWTEAVFSR